MSLASALGISASAVAKQKGIVSVEKKMKVVVVGAHPDDPESICGGTMCLLSNNGHEIVSVYLTTGERGIPGVSMLESAEIRKKEAINASKMINSRPEFIGQIDGDTEVNTNRYDEVRSFLEGEKPDIVFTHWPVDAHRDHRACSLLVYDAWLALGKSFVLFYCEAMTGMQSMNFQPSLYVDITSVADRKRKACYEHKSQNVESWYAQTHEIIESFRGLEYGCRYAEAFVEQMQGPSLFELLNGKIG